MSMLLLLSAFLFAGSGIAQSQVPPPTPLKSSQKPEANPAQHNEASAKDQRGTETSPLIIKVLPSQTIEPESSKEQKETSKDTSAEWWLVYVTGVLCVITLALAFFTGWLWNATKKLVIGADKTAKHKLRAYMGVESIEVRAPGIDELRGVVTIANFGQTMAKDLEFWIAGAFTVAINQKFPWGDRKLKTVVMPGERVMFEEPIVFGKHDFVMMDQGTTSAIFWGKITYTDVFGNNHWTIFRFVTYERQGSSWKTRASQEGNDAGEGEPPLPITR